MRGGGETFVLKKKIEVKPERERNDEACLMGDLNKQVGDVKR